MEILRVRDELVCTLVRCPSADICAGQFVSISGAYHRPRAQRGRGHAAHRAHRLSAHFWMRVSIHFP